MHGQLANVHRATGDYLAAFEHYYKAIDQCEQLGDRGSWAANTANLANLLLYTGDYPSALERYHKALAVHIELDRKMNIAVVIGNIGNIHSAQGRYADAIDHYNRAYDLHVELDDRHGMARVLGNLGKVQAAQGDQSGARENFNRSLEIHESLGVDVMRYETILDIVYTYMRSEDYDKAAELLSSLDGERILDPRIYITLERARAEVRLEQGDVEGARVELEKLIDYAREKQQPEGEVKVRDDLMYVARAANDLEAYIKHSEASRALENELSGSETKRQLLHPREATRNGSS